MHSILLQVLRGNWYIDPDFAKSSGFLVSQMLKGQLSFSGEAEKFKPSVNSSNYSNGNDAPSEKLSAVISISGPLTKQDQFCGPSGMDTIGQWIREFDNDPTISSVILKVNSPGGTVEGTAILGQTINDCSKPIIAYVDEMACSGGYWIASQCDEIFASTPRARLGSIGVMLAFADMQPAWEKEGVVFHEVYSKHSPDKNKDFADLKKGSYENYTKDVLDPLAEDFIAVIKSKREILDESIFKGRTVFASDAIDIGLIDSIGTLEDVIQRSLVLADKREDEPTGSLENENIKPDSQNLSEMKKFPLLAALISVESLEVTKDGAHLQQDWLETIEDALEKASSTYAKESELDRQISAYVDTIADRDQKITELAYELAEIKTAAGAQSASLSVSADKEKKEAGDPMVNELNNAKDTSEKLEIMRKYGYGS